MRRKGGKERETSEGVGGGGWRRWEERDRGREGKNGGRMRDQRGARGWKPFLQMSSIAFKSLWACKQRSDCHRMLWRATLMKVPGRERKLWSAEHCPVFRRKKCTMKVQWQCSPLLFSRFFSYFSGPTLLSGTKWRTPTLTLWCLASFLALSLLQSSIKPSVEINIKAG